MRLGMYLPYAGGFATNVDRLPDCHRAGIDIVYVPEAYSFDAVSQLGFIAAKVPGIEIGSDILPVYTRTPALIAMTAAGLDNVSGGRFTLGIGASGPQVVEGFHGVAYDSPIATTRDVIEICRRVWRRERLEYSTARFSIPLAAERGGSGLGKPLKLINTPIRERIPIMLAAMGPRNVRLAAELAEQWAPFFFQPEGYRQVWGDDLDAGGAKRDPALGALGIVATVPLAIVEDGDKQSLDACRASLALYIGGMGARGKNFYFDLAVRYGYEQAATKIQNLYLDGHKRDAEAAVPEELIRRTSLIGPRRYLTERVAAFAAAGVTTLILDPLTPDHSDRLAAIEAIATLVK